VLEAITGTILVERRNIDTTLLHYNAITGQGLADQLKAGITKNNKKQELQLN